MLVGQVKGGLNIRFVLNSHGITLQLSFQLLGILLLIISLFELFLESLDLCFFGQLYSRLGCTLLFFVQFLLYSSFNLMLDLVFLILLFLLFRLLCFLLGLFFWLWLFLSITFLFGLNLRCFLLLIILILHHFDQFIVKMIWSFASILHCNNLVKLIDLTLDFSLESRSQFLKSLLLLSLWQLFNLIIFSLLSCCWL